MANGNGDKTLDYFDKAFGFNGRQALALMGAHTTSKYNVLVNTDNTYAWLRQMQNSLFNNRYYKVLSERKSKVYDECIGTMSNEVALSKWTAKTSVLRGILKKPDLWATSENPGHLRWSLSYERGPNCAANTLGYVQYTRLKS